MANEQERLKQVIKHCIGVVTDNMALVNSSLKLVFDNEEQDSQSDCLQIDAAHEEILDSLATLTAFADKM